MDYWIQMREQLNSIWDKFTSWQKWTIVGAAAATVLGMIFLVIVPLMKEPDMEPLYTGLEQKTASEIVAKLDEKKVDYQLADEGKTILVKSDEKYQLRLDLADEVDVTGVVGFETFNETRFGETDTDKRVRFLVALQGELSRTIKELEEVESVKVHIAMPTPSLFIEDENDATASVLLRLNPNVTLKPEQVKSIMAFVSNSVEGLKPGNVTVMDVNGNLLSEDVAENGETPSVTQISSGQLAMKQDYEKTLAKSVQSMLERMIGVGKVVVRANVDIDFDQVETVSEIVSDPVMVSEQTKEESSSGVSAATGGNPADANMGGPTYGSVDSTDSEYQLSERIRNYDTSRTVETKIAAPGKVEQVSVSVLIDGELAEEDQEKIAQAVSQAAGANYERGDQVSIVAMPFNNEELQKLEDQMAQAEARERRNEYIRYGLIGLGILLLCGLGVYAIRTYRKGKQEGEFIGSMEAAAAGQSGVSPLSIELTPEMLEKKNIRDKIEGIVNNNPDEVAKVLKTWLAEE